MATNFISKHHASSKSQPGKRVARAKKAAWRFLIVFGVLAGLGCLRLIAPGPVDNAFSWVSIRISEGFSALPF